MRTLSAFCTLLLSIIVTSISMVILTPVPVLAIPGSACEGAFKPEKFYIIHGPQGVAYVEGRKGLAPKVRYHPLKSFDADTNVIETGGTDPWTKQRFEDHFYPPAKFPGWAWVLRKYEGSEDRTQWIWFDKIESEPAETAPLAAD